MKNMIISGTKFILTIIFFYVINQLLSLFFGTLVPGPDEMNGAIFIYLFIFIGEIILANLCTYFVFRVAKSEAK